MIVQRTRGIRTLLGVAQGVAVSLLFWTTFAGLTQAVPGSEFFASRYVLYWIAVLAGFSLEMAVRSPDKLVAPIYESSIVRHFPVALRQMVFAVGGLLVLVVLTKDHAISRGFVLAFAASLYPVLLWSNATLPSRLTRLLFRGRRESETLLVGPSARVRAINTWLARKEQLGVRVAGLVSTDGPPRRAFEDIPYLGGLEVFEGAICDSAISQVILLELPSPGLARRLISGCEQNGIRLIIVNDFAEQIHRPIVSRVDEGVNVLTLFEEPLENPFNRVLKRALDLAIAIPVVAFVLPVFTVVVALLQSTQSRGPIFHRQRRAGLKNRPFNIFKFRTMHAEDTQLDRQASRNDTRIFRGGRLLRRFSLDEIPQFLNVLRGEMSVVGPRPHLVEHNRKFADVLENYHVRAFIKPGITGLAQVRGFRGEARTHEDIAARLQSDLVYIENWSLILDLIIITRTIWQMIRPPSTAF